MDSRSIEYVAYRRRAERAYRPGAFSLLEMMMVVTLILIVASITTPIYQTCVLRGREAVLRHVPDGT